MKHLVLMIILTTLSQASIAKMRNCHRSDGIGLRGLPVIDISLDQLPKARYAASGAEYFITSAQSEIPIFRENQSFKDASTEIVCFSAGAKQDRKNFSLAAPTIIDLRTSHQEGDMFWNFQSFLSQQKAGAWNQPSTLSSRQSFADWYNQHASKIKFFKIHPTSYVLQIQSQDGPFTQHLILKYDIVD